MSEMPGSTLYNDEGTWIRIRVSRPAERLIGLKNVPAFVKVLREMMEALQAETAYVGKSGAAVEIHLLRRDGWTGHMKLQRGP